jgi:general secretion pathway protein F
MPAFEYTALDTRGRTRKGVLEGDTPRHVRQQLKEQSLSPLTVAAVIGKVKRVDGKGRQIKVSRISVSTTDLALITRQLATLVRSGLTLEESLQAIGQQADKTRIKTLLLAVRSRVLEGHTLADGLADFPAVFPDLYRATVAAGEQSGHLDIVLERLAEYTENRQRMRQKTLMALFYPLLLSIVAFLVVFGLLAYVVPQVVEVFVNMRQELPWLTKTLIQLSDFLNQWWLVLLLITVGGVFLSRYLLRSPATLFQFHLLILRLPLLGRLERGANTARFTRTLSILIASGVPVLEALKITSEVIDNLPMRKAIIEATERVREGSSLYSALGHSRLFPPIMLYLIASGENSGKLEDMLERAAENQENELETLIGVLLGLFEPLLILFMGAIVLVIVLAILMPIFELNQLVQ